MGVRRSGIVGTTLAIALLGPLLYRLGESAGPPPTAESNQAARAFAGTAEEGKKGKKKSKSSTNEPAKKGYATSTPESGKTGVESEEGPWLALRQHFAGQSAYSSVRNRANSEPAGTAQTPDCSEETEQNAFQPQCIPGERVKALIAIVPDPVRTHMPLRFDRAIDAVQLAAASMNYLIDRYWLPWDLELKTDWDDYDSYISAKIERKQEERQPALLIFRRQDKPDESKPTILLVFLVSETPTAGINGDQFDRAVCYADLLNEADRSSKGDCSSEQALRASEYIVGPTFSASF